MTQKFNFGTILNAVTTMVKKSVICIGFTFLIYMFLLFGSSMRKFESTSMRYKIEDQITRYLLIKTVLSLIAAAGAYLIYGLLLHLPMAIIFSMLFFVFNFVPHIVKIVPIDDK
jgi:singapore isolate B (sub-type 7) whole genome shotgun sequence assembly, scaffold_9